MGSPEQKEDPKWIVEAIKQGIVSFSNSGTPNVKMFIISLGGTMTANVGDFIIRGVNGEIYPCKPNIFFKSYEQVSDERAVLHHEKI